METENASDSPASPPSDEPGSSSRPALRVLVIDDNPVDADAIERHLSRAFTPQVLRVDEPLTLQHVLREHSLDVVLCDYRMPKLEFAHARALLARLAPELPLIVVSGLISETEAARLMGSGVRDYVIKDNLKRLIPAIRRELRDAEVRMDLADETRLMHGLMEHLPEAIFVKDRHHRILRLNAAALRMLDLEQPEQVIGRTLQELGSVNSGSIQRIEESLLRADDCSMGNIDPWTTPNGAQRWLANTLVRLPGHGPEQIRLVHIAHDITHIMVANEAVQESESRFRQFAENVSLAFWLCDAELDQTLYVNPAYGKLWGRSCESLYEDAASFLEGVVDEDRAAVEHALNMLDDEVEECEFRIRRPDGSQAWLHCRFHPIRNARGEVERIGVIAENVTARIEHEQAQREVEEQLRHTQKMEALGSLVGGVAHDFNNILAVVLGNLELCQMNHAQECPHKARNYIGNALDSAQRGAALTRRLLSLTRRQVLQPVVLDINAAIGELRPLLVQTVGEQIEMIMQLDEDAGRVRCDAAELQATLINLAANARDAMPEGGRLLVSTRIDAADQNRVIIEVADNGTGISQSDLDRIFDPFFSTKDVGKGTGLGLSMAHGFATQAGGDIRATSRLGEGTCFTLRLPRECSDLDDTERTVRAPLRRGNERILVVEDDDVVRETVVNLLRQLGYRIYTATCGEDALGLIQQHEDIALLFTDVRMPGRMNGPELVDRARELRPGLKVLFTSGYVGEVHAGRSDDITQWIGKPYEVATLSARLDILLSRPQQANVA